MEAGIDCRLCEKEIYIKTMIIIYWSVGKKIT